MKTMLVSYVKNLFASLELRKLIKKFLCFFFLRIKKTSNASSYLGFTSFKILLNSYKNWVMLVRTYCFFIFQLFLKHTKLRNTSYELRKLMID
jgi:hypothetical protein